MTESVRRPKGGGGGAGSAPSKSATAKRKWLKFYTHVVNGAESTR